MGEIVSGKAENKSLVSGDDAIESFNEDWLGFCESAARLSEQLYKVSESSGVCCGIIGSWGSGKSSFMKLMDEYVREKSSWKGNARAVWFTAWDPGGIQDLGDAMLYRFFSSVAGKDKEMAETLKKLEKALGVRRGLRERAHRFLEKVSQALPAEGKMVTAFAGAFLEELESSSSIRECFDELMDWLRKKERTVFFFVDDVDRASGEQILDLLSELRLYVSRRRVVAVLGYSEDYVVKALGQVLPKEIEPREYLEKIITVRRNVPTPTGDALAFYAVALIKHLLPDLKDRESQLLGYRAARLSLNNPRKLKRLILIFAQLIQSIENYKQLDYDVLLSILLTTAVFDMGFLADEKIAQTIEKGREDEIKASLQEFAEKNPDKSKEAQLLINEIERLPPAFIGGTVSRLRLAGVLPSEPEIGKAQRERAGFDWSSSFTHILSSAATQGFTLTPKIAESSIRTVVPQNTNIKKFERKPWIPPFLLEVYECGCVLSWKDSDLFVFALVTLRQYLPIFCCGYAF
jgi:hypothetical protein